MKLIQPTPPVEEHFGIEAAIGDTELLDRVVIGYRAEDGCIAVLRTIYHNFDPSSRSSVSSKYGFVRLDADVCPKWICKAPGESIRLAMNAGKPVALYDSIEELILGPPNPYKEVAEALQAKAETTPEQPRPTQMSPAFGAPYGVENHKVASNEPWTPKVGDQVVRLVTLQAHANGWVKTVLPCLVTKVETAAQLVELKSPGASLGFIERFSEIRPYTGQP